MLDVAIIGGGLSGLALAHSLQARRVDWALFESRDRFGGRVLTRKAANGAAIDLGAMWYWPATQPSMSRLVDDLGLVSLPQPDEGQLLLLDDPNREPRLCAFDARRGQPALDPAMPAQPGALHGGARRLAGGMGALIDALVQRLQASRLQLGHHLLRVVDAGRHVELQLQAGADDLRVPARRVVLALPPRLAAERIAFEPALPADLLQAMVATPTWMAAAAKAGLACGQAPWREAAHRGNAWVAHAQAVLAEVFDAGLPEGPGALAGRANCCCRTGPRSATPAAPPIGPTMRAPVPAIRLMAMPGWPCRTGTGGCGGPAARPRATAAATSKARSALPRACGGT